jgi:hypothetical protein
LAGLAGLLFVLPGCSFLLGPDTAYRVNDDVIAAASRAAGFAVDSDLYEVERVEAERDTVTLYYRGVEGRRAEAWMLRFSRKPSEQDPVALEDVYSHLTLIRELRDEFRLGKEASEEIDGARLRYAAYQFRSTARGSDGKPLTGQGIVATLAREQDDHPVVFALRLEIIDQREALSRSDLGPFVDAMLR